MAQLSGLDSLFINMEMRGLPMHISSFSLYDPGTASGNTVSFEEIKKTYETAVLQHVPTFRAVLHEVPLGLDQPYWVEDEDFNIDLHIHRMGLPHPGDWSALLEVLATMHSEPLCREKPLWEAWVIENLDGVESFPKGCFGVFLKVHHALMDGRTGLKIFTSLHALGAREAPIALANAEGAKNHDNHFEGNQSYRKPSTLSMLGRSASNNAGRTFGIANLASTKLPQAWSRIRKGLGTDELKTIGPRGKICFNDVTSQRRVIDRIRIPIATVRAIRSTSSGCTLNDVAMTIVGGAMQRYLLAMDVLPEASLIAAVPIDVRCKADASKAGNMLSIMSVSLASDVGDSLARLEQVHIESSYSKKYSHILGNEIVDRVLNNIYPALLSWAMPSFIKSSLMSKLPCICNTVITNVPGTSAPLYLAGAKLVESFGMGPLIPNVSLFHTITSTGDAISISFVSCPEAMTRPALYKQCLVESYQDLVERTDAQAVVTPIKGVKLEDLERMPLVDPNPPSRVANT